MRRPFNMDRFNPYRYSDPEREEERITEMYDNRVRMMRDDAVLNSTNGHDEELPAGPAASG